MPTLVSMLWGSSIAAQPRATDSSNIMTDMAAFQAVFSYLEN